MRAIDHILIRWVCALALSAVVLLPSKALVICVGEHGHAAIEWVHPDTACGHDDSIGVVSGPCFVTGHCHSSCEDTTLPTVVATGSPQKKVDLAGVELPAPRVLFVIAWEPMPPTASASLIPAARLDHQLGRSLSSTILLI